MHVFFPRVFPLKPGSVARGLQIFSSFQLLPSRRNRVRLLFFPRKVEASEKRRLPVKRGRGEAAMSDGGGGLFDEKIVLFDVGG